MGLYLLKSHWGRVCSAAGRNTGVPLSDLIKGLNGHVSCLRSLPYCPVVLVCVRLMRDTDSVYA